MQTPLAREFLHVCTPIASLLLIVYPNVIPFRTVFVLRLAIKIADFFLGSLAPDVPLPCSFLLPALDSCRPLRMVCLALTHRSYQFGLRCKQTAAQSGVFIHELADVRTAAHT